MCFDWACSKPDVMHLCVALRIEQPGRLGGWHCAKHLVIDHGLNARSHTSSGPTSKTRGDTGAMEQEMEEQQSLDIFHSGMGLLIVRSTEESGFVITVTFLKILSHKTVCRGCMAKCSLTVVKLLFLTWSCHDLFVYFSLPYMDLSLVICGIFSLLIKAHWGLF